MDRSMIDRINELARKAKTEGLTDAEKAEQKRLRDAYRFAFRANLTEQLDHTYIMEPDGSKHKFGTPPKKRHK
ncbi:MAG: DUF896 domain-containing protein [Oscillospiraceae bacterium]|nr:DUF896 domain-containing protein [Oscillospiraceae bacterium]